MKNTAYPNFSPDSNFVKPVYNLNRWLTAMRELYTKMHFGNDYKNAFGAITTGWDVVEANDFSAWLEFYQSNSHTKYKKAQFYAPENIGGYYLPNSAKPAMPPPVPDISDPVSVAHSDLREKMDQNQKRKLMEDQRKKIISRLQAAIKYLTSYEGHLLTGDEFASLLRSMHALVEQFHNVNKISLSNQLYKDLIIRQANKLHTGGFIRSSSFLHKIAQNMPGKFDFQQGALPIASKPGDGVAGSLTNPTPPIEALTTPPPPVLEEDDPLSQMSDELETGGLTEEKLMDNNSSEDDELEDVSLDDTLSVEAQFVPPTDVQSEMPVVDPTMPAQAPLKTVAPKPDDLEVSLPEKPQAEPQGTDIDVVMDQAMANVTIADVVKKIESINAIFQNRTITRELSVIDLMLSHLGLSSYFSNLSEIIQKNHESANYSLSRLSDILNKLRGATADDTLKVNENTQLSPEVQQVQQKLQEQQIKDDKRKEMRKQMQEDELAEAGQEKEENINPAAPPPSPIPSITTPTEIAQTPAQIV